MKIKTWKILSSLVVVAGMVLTFQNCGNIQLLLTDPNASLSSMAIKETPICSSFQSVQDVSRYQITQSFVVNLTSLRYSRQNVADSNANGVPDIEEAGGVPSASVLVSGKDADGDGVPDFIEILKGTNPYRDDMDEDGVDRDGVTNLQEIQKGTDPQGGDPNDQFVFSALASADQDYPECGAGQISYNLSLQVNNLVAMPAWVDAATGDWSLSHDMDENDIFIGYRTLPTNANLSAPLFYGFLLKMKRGDKTIPALSPGDFHLLPDQ